MAEHTGLSSHLEKMTLFHWLAYQRLLETVAVLDDELYHADQRLFFSSIHRTLNHLHLVDCLWHWRLTATQPEFWVTGLDMEVEPERPALIDKTLARAQAFHQTVQLMSEADLMRTITVKTLSGGEMARPAHLLVSTLVNHGTHHRGQICAVLSQNQIEYPALDVPFFDQLVEQ